MAFSLHTTSTARWIAAARGRETTRPDRLFDDPYADRFAGEIGRAALARSEEATGGENAFLVIRTRYFDDALVDAVTENGQAVLLGAGFDTRAYRLPLPATARVFELDREELLAEKNLVLETAVTRCARTTVGVDMAGDWATALIKAGFSIERPTVWIAEGVLFYLTTEIVGATLRAARDLSTTGSLFLADTFGSGLLSQRSMQPYLRWAEQFGLPPPFCTDEPEALFTRCGWRDVDVRGPGDDGVSHGRFPRPGTHVPDSASRIDRAYLVRAVAR